MDTQVIPPEHLAQLAARSDIQKYFHVETGTPLCAGQVLAPSRVFMREGSDAASVNQSLQAMGLDELTRFGEKFIFGMTHEQDWKWETALREVLCEWVRRACFPDEMSRLRCVFALASLDDARKYKARMTIPTASVWEVGADSASKKDLNWLGQRNTLAEIVDWMTHYWSGKATDDPMWEYLLVPQVIVFRRVE